MSTITDPGLMASTAAAVTSSGGRRPGTCAVVITTSCCAMWRSARPAGGTFLRVSLAA